MQRVEDIIHKTEAPTAAPEEKVYTTAESPREATARVGDTIDEETVQEMRQTARAADSRVGEVSQKVAFEEELEEPFEPAVVVAHAAENPVARAAEEASAPETSHANEGPRSRPVTEAGADHGVVFVVGSVTRGIAAWLKPQHARIVNLPLRMVAFGVDTTGSVLEAVGDRLDRGSRLVVDTLQYMMRMRGTTEAADDLAYSS